jgi:hypothetical protein
LRFNASLARSVFAEAQKAADLVAQFRHRLEIWDFGSACHIVIRYNRSTIYDVRTTRVKMRRNYFPNSALRRAGVADVSIYG